MIILAHEWLLVNAYRIGPESRRNTKIIGIKCKNCIDMVFNRKYLADNEFFIEPGLRNTFQRRYVLRFTALVLFSFALGFGQGGSMSSATNGTNVSAIHGNTT